MKPSFCTVKYLTTVRQLPGIFVLVLLSCAPGTDIGGPPFSADLLPPILQSAQTLDERHISFLFDEPLKITPSLPEISPELPLGQISTDGMRLNIGFTSDQIIGESYTMRITVSDEDGNTLSFLHNFSGWNPRVPELLINELNPRGSGKTPDCIELYAIKGGNLGGLSLRVGTDNRYSEEIVFPAIEIPDGEYILVHPKSEGSADEVDELGALDESGGLLSSDMARDFWMPGSPGLPGNNGAITLYARRNGPVIDAVLWSDRVDDPADEKLGWTSEGYIFACDLSANASWSTADSETPFPSDAIDVSKSTATRSLCRASNPVDSNTAGDWHTVPTRGKSFGSANTDDVYVP